MSTESRQERSEAGFSLLEALIATGLLLLGVTAVTNLFLIAASSNSAANQSTGATAVASQQLERLKALPFEQLAPGGSVETNTIGYFREEPVPGVGLILTRWEISVTNSDPSLLYIRVRSEGRAALAAGRSRAEFTTFRACTVQAAPFSCP